MELTEKHAASDNKNNSTKIMLLWHRFGPYHHARFQAAASTGPTVGVEFSGEDQTYAWKKIRPNIREAVITLFPDRDSQTCPSNVIFQRVSEVFSSQKPSIVFIPGWADKTALAAFKWCLKNSVPAVVMSPSQALDAPRSWYKEWVKSRIVRLYSGGLAGGTPQKRYLESLGIPMNRILTGYNVVDNGHFENGARQARKIKVQLRKQLKIPENYFICSARFVPKKNLEILLEAYASYAQSGLREVWDLVVLGDGPLRKRLENIIKKFGLAKKVYIPGFKQYEELPYYYGLSKALVLPSISEQWGLVVNEAMACGLPVIVSNRCGCVEDLVREGENGFIIDPVKSESLTQALIKITRLKGQLPRMGKRSQQIVKNWSPKTFAKQVWKLAEMITAAQPPKPNILDRFILDYVSRKTMIGYQDR